MRSTAYRECPGLVNESFNKSEIPPHLKDGENAQATLDIIIDFEILTDEISCLIGLLLSYSASDKKEIENGVKENLIYISELVYHSSTALRIKNTITKEEIQKIESFINDLEISINPRHKKIVIPSGSTVSVICHLLRVKCNSAVRLLHRYNNNNKLNPVDALCQDLFNLLSGYFSYTALKLNEFYEIEEIEFKSRLKRSL